MATAIGARGLVLHVGRHRGRGFNSRPALGDLAAILEVPGLGKSVRAEDLDAARSAHAQGVALRRPS